MAVINRPAAAVVAIMVLAACGNDSGGSGTAARTDSVTVIAVAATSPKGATIPGVLSDANIFYLLDVSNRGDSTKGAVASAKGTSAEVRGFAKMMVRDHHTLRQQGEALSKRLAIQPTPPAGDSLPAKLKGAISNLTAAAKGRDFDKAYIDHEVAAHRELLTMVVAAMSATRNSEIKNLIQKAAPVVQAHLDKAKVIQKDIQK